MITFVRLILYEYTVRYDNKLPTMEFWTDFNTQVGSLRAIMALQSAGAPPHASITMWPRAYLSKFTPLNLDGGSVSVRWVFFF